ncbi:ribulose-phosphate 3-epimerase [Clostridia bacterium OttesenSCG-928-F22]|nr:ribulose-phosphate 3-epimerase [Clostridia bacterium OttesenSCG-928-F22]
MTKIAPSILSADFARMGEDTKMLAKCGADYIHVDVMDGQFVPNITFGQEMVRALKRCTDIPLDVHLMVDKPERFIDEFIDAGADILTVHQEATPHVYRAIQMIKKRGVKAGVALNPSTPVEMLKSMLDDIDLVLIMTVNPGFGGQKFIAPMIKKLEKMKAIKDYFGYQLDIEVDGGINDQTAVFVRNAGADILVAGNAVFSAEDKAQAIKDLRG